MDCVAEVNDETLAVVSAVLQMAGIPRHLSELEGRALQLMCRFQLTAHELTAGDKDTTIAAAAAATDRHGYGREEVLWDQMGEVKGQP